MLGDLGERPVHRLGVGDIAHDPEQPVGHPGTAMGHRDLVPVGEQPPGHGQTDSTVAAGDQYRS